MAFQSKVGTFQRPAAGTTNTVITGVGFQPKAIIFLESSATVDNTWTAKMENVVGWAAAPVGDPAASTVISWSAQQAHNNANATPAGKLSVQVGLVQVDGAAAVQSRDTAAAGGITFQSDGFTINWENSPYDAQQEFVAYLALGGDVQAAIGSYSKNLGLTELNDVIKLESDVGFVPSVAMIMAAPVGSFLNTQSIGVVGGPGNQWAMSLQDSAGADPSDNRRRLSNDRALHLLRSLHGSRISRLGPDGLDLSILESNTWWNPATIGTGVAGSGTAPVQFSTPAQVAVSPFDGNLFVADTINGRVMRFDSVGNYISSIGSLFGPVGVAVDISGNIYITMSFAGVNSIRKYNNAHTLQWESPALSAAVKHIATDSTHLFVVLGNTLAKRLCSTGALVLERGKTAGSADGQFNLPRGIAVHGDEVYVVDTGNNRVQVLTKNFGFLRKFGTNGAGNGQFSGPRGVAVEPSGNFIIVADYGNDRWQRLTKDGVFQASGTHTPNPDGVAIRADGLNVWITDADVHRMRQLTRDSLVSTISTLYLGNILANTGVTAKTTTTGTPVQDIATTVKGKAALVAHINSTTINAEVDRIAYAVGIVDSANIDAQMAGHAADNAATSDSDSYFHSTIGYVKTSDPANPTVSQSFASVSMPAGTSNLRFGFGANDASADYVAWLVMGEKSDLSGIMAGQADLNVDLLRNMLHLSGDMRGEVNFSALAFGTVGNFSGGIVAGAALASVVGIKFDRFFEGVVPAAAIASITGIKFDRLFEGTVLGEAILTGIKLGTKYEITGMMTAAAIASITGIKFDRLFTGVVPAAANLETYFRILMPSIRSAAEDELLGTINWVLNPSLESGLFGWEAEGGATITHTSTEGEQWDGIWGAEINTTLSIGQGFHVESVTGLELTGTRPDGANRKVIGQVRLRSEAEELVGFSSYMRVFYQDGTEEVTDPTPIIMHNLPEFERFVSSAAELNPAKVLIRVEFVITSTVAIFAKFWADGGQIEEDKGQGATPWVTGAYGAETGKWVAVPNMSMSVREPLPLSVRGIGRGGSVTIEAFMYRTDAHNTWIEDVSDTVIEARVTMDVSRRSTWQLDCTMTPAGYKKLKPNEDWLAPYLRITHPNGEVRENQLGHFLLIPSARRAEEYKSTYRISAFDILWLMDRQSFGDIISHPFGTNYAAAIRGILSETRLSDGTKFDRFVIPDAAHLMGEAHEWNAETTRLKAANDLAEAGALYPLWSTNAGYVHTKRMGPERLAQQAPVKAWAANIPKDLEISPWIPRIASLKSEVVGGIETFPKALDFVDKILISSGSATAPRVQVVAQIETSPDAADRSVQRTFPFENTGLTKHITGQLITSPIAAQSLAYSIADDLTAQVEHIKMSVLPDPQPDYCRATAVVGTWDAYMDPVAVGLYVVRRVTFGFTPSTCLQVMDLDFVGAGENHITSVIVA